MVLKCARAVVAEHGGSFPTTSVALRGLPGIGPYTAAAIAAIAHDEAATVIDGNVERVVSRLFAVEAPLPGAKAELAQHAARLTPADRPGDHAQAMMDLGATICTPRAPACGICPLRGDCRAYATGVADSLPRRAARPAKPERRGIAYVAMRPDGSVLLERRPEKGLLGGMLGWPGTEWVPDDPAHAPPLPADWKAAPVPVRHTFTHFHLTLRVMTATVNADAAPDRGTFHPCALFRPSDLPTVMRKVFDASLLPRNSD
jgi:A/G-specific adenine glycosylase